MNRANVHDQADVGVRDRCQLGDLAGAAHRHLEDERLDAAVGLEDRQRQPDLGVQVLAVRVDARPGAAQQRGEDVLGRRLAGGARDPHHAAAELVAPGAREHL